MERLTIEKIKSLKEAMRSNMNVYFYDDVMKVFDELLEKRNAEEQGLLLRLPCKVGDTLWWTNAYGDLCSSEVNSMFIEHGIDGIVIETLICNINEKEIGKTVFLTKEEANSLLNDFLEGDEQNEQINRCR